MVPSLTAPENSCIKTVQPTIIEGFLFAATVVGAVASIPQGAAGTSHFFTGQIQASGGTVTSASTQFPNTNTLSIVEGSIVPSAAGNVALTFGCELSTTAGVVIKQGTNGIIEQLN